MTKVLYVSTIGNLMYVMTCQIHILAQ